MKDKPTTNFVSVKPYRCKSCGNGKGMSTNHYGEVYPHCRICNRQTTWECMIPIPKNMSTPTAWKQVKLGDIARIIQAKEKKK